MVVKTLKRALALGISTSVLISGSAMAADTQLLWGDTHLHKSYSADAFMMGNRDAGPDTAYRVAKGEPVIHPFNRVRVQLSRPLDFLVVADHAEGLGVVRNLYREDPDLGNAWFWQRWMSAFFLGQIREVMDNPEGAIADFSARMPEGNVAPDGAIDPIATSTGEERVGPIRRIIPPKTLTSIAASTWQSSVEAAEAHYEPGVFTPIIGWEWTQAAMGVSLHRVVMSTLDGPTAATIDPVGRDDAPYPEDLWRELDALQEATGARFLSIPHNSNRSRGYMFGEKTIRGEVITADFARTRLGWEPVIEVTQFKGDSETHPALSPDDEFADFERFEFNVQRPPQHWNYVASVGDYARSALRRGLEMEERLGVNPYQFGMIGSTDSHTSIPSSEEPNFWGKIAVDSIPENKRRENADGIVSGINSFNGWNMSASGIAAVWATENTREAIFEAFKRKEVYATTGPRIALRVFGGWSFDEAATGADDIADIGYAAGVPMGGDLSNPPANGDAVQLLIRATRDPKSANLDRVQVIKGWLDDSGNTHEHIFDVAWSDDRRPDTAGKLPAVGNTVDLMTGRHTDDIGATEFSVLWSDPTFDPGQSAFYYVRVLQIPTVRHSQLDAIALGQDTPYEGPATIQERAYSSPIWFKPS